MADPLKRPASAHRRSKRLGCGHGSGKGKTCGRGHKGAGQRSGKEQGPKFEGGQMPLTRRIPKRGMQKGKKINHMHQPKGGANKHYQLVNLVRLADWDPEVPVNPKALAESGIIRSATRPVKLLARGEVKKPLNITVQAASQKAREAIEAAGGKLEVAS